MFPATHKEFLALPMSGLINEEIKANNKLYNQETTEVINNVTNLLNNKVTNQQTKKLVN
jgi:hypothetical protein